MESSIERSKESDTASRKKEEVKVEHHSSDEDEEEVKQKRNPDTVCHNPEFDRRLRERSMSPKIDYLGQHIQSIRSIDLGKGLKPRIDIPDNIKLYGYGNQKLNLWEFQKDQLRHQVASDTKHHYTYSKDYLQAAFPLTNEIEAAAIEKAQI